MSRFAMSKFATREDRESAILDALHRAEAANVEACGLLLNVLAGHRIDNYPPERQMIEKCYEILSGSQPHSERDGANAR